MDIIYTVACQLSALEMREVIDRVFNKGSLIGVILEARDDSEDTREGNEGCSEFVGQALPSEIKGDTSVSEYITPCTYNVILTRAPSKEELRALGCAFKFSGAELLEPYEELVERIRYRCFISFVIVTRNGGSHWLNGQPVQTPAVLEFIASHLEKVAALARQRAKDGYARPDRVKAKKVQP
jgi:hypothetical protein